MVIASFVTPGPNKTIYISNRKEAVKCFKESTLLKED